MDRKKGYLHVRIGEDTEHKLKVLQECSGFTKSMLIRIMVDEFFNIFSKYQKYFKNFVDKSDN